MDEKSDAKVRPTGLLLTVGEASRLLGVHPNTLRAWGASRKLPEQRIGVRRDDIVRLKTLMETQPGQAVSASERYAGLAVPHPLWVRDLPTWPMLGVDFSHLAPALSAASHLGELVAQWQVGIASDLNRMLQPSASFASVLADLDVSSLGVTRQLQEVLENQVQIASLFGAIAKLIPPHLSADLISAALPSQRAIAQIAVMGASLAPERILAEQLALTFGQFRIFTAQIAEQLERAGAAEGDGAISVDELDLGSGILARSVGGFDPSRSPAVAAETLGLRPTSPTAYDALSLTAHELRGELLQVPRPQIMERLRQSLPVQISHTASRAADLRYQCSRSAQLRTGEPVFRATTETDLAAAMLPQSVARSEEEFAYFIDLIFYYVYESSGDLGRVTSVDASMIDRHPILVEVKWLRHYFRHDLNHGKPGEAAGKFRRIGDLFIRLVGVSVPDRPSLWEQAQLRILRKLVEALEDLRESLGKGAIP